MSEFMTEHRVGLTPQGSAAGIEIDGALYPLEGEPPPAVPGSWWKPLAD